jgi:streptogramin lyase
MSKGGSILGMALTYGNMKFYKYYILLLLFLLIKPVFGKAASLPADTLKYTGKFKNLGVQVAEKWLEGSVFTEDDDGNEWVYTVLRGKPGYLLGYNLTKSSLQVNLPLERMDGAWDITVSSDGWLYIAGSAGGRLAKHRPGSQKVEDLGKPLSSETYLFAVTPGKNGEIFGATYPGCRIFRYHPSDGFKDVCNGPIVPSENYVHGIAYHEKTNKLFAGIGSHSYLVEIDLTTGQKMEILPGKYRGLPGFVYDMGIVKGLNGGDRLFANLPDQHKTLVYNLDKKTFDTEIPKIIMVKGVVKSPYDQKVYYTDSSSLIAHDVLKPTVSPQLLVKTSRAMNMKWGKDKKLYLLNSDGDLIQYDPISGKTVTKDLMLPPQPIGINITKTGPDGRIWTGGYLVGSNATYDPKTGKTQRYFGLHQSESITLNGSDMYFGIYPKGKFYKYDTRKPWDLKEGNPKLLGHIEGQDRPFCGTGIPESDHMFFGTVPDYGRLGGALIEYDPKIDKLIAYEGLVPKLSLVSMIYHEKEIIAGTSVWGGLGIKPEVNEAKLFGWDPQRKVKTFELVPVPGAKAITCLIKGPDGNLWGVADGVLFVLNARLRKVISSHKLFELTAQQKSSAVWRDVNLVIHPSGQVYGTGNGRLFHIDPQSKKARIISEKPAFFVSMDKQGILYFRDGKDLWSYTP